MSDMDEVNATPMKERLFVFQTWKIDHFCLTPFELTISEIYVAFFIRTGHRVFKWEYLRRWHIAHD